MTMKNILSRANREVLEQYAWSNVLLAFDFDGTLAPIVAEPDRAGMRQATRKLLFQLTKLYPCIIISGRSQADALKRIEDTGVHTVVGNHGVEPWKATDRVMNEVAGWMPILEERLSPYRGVVIENKRFSVAVHYRMSREKKKAHPAILRAAAELGDVRIVGGKLVVNILPHGAPHKGMALERERERFQCDTAIYVGDDETDEDVFALDRPGRLLTIRVGAKRASLASYFITSQAEIDELLRALLGLRRSQAAYVARKRSADR